MLWRGGSSDFSNIDLGKLRLQAAWLSPSLMICAWNYDVASYFFYVDSVPAVWYSHLIIHWLTNTALCLGKCSIVVGQNTALALWRALSTLCAPLIHPRDVQARGAVPDAVGRP